MEGIISILKKKILKSIFGGNRNFVKDETASLIKKYRCRFLQNDVVSEEEEERVLLIFAIQIWCRLDTVAC